MMDGLIVIDKPAGWTSHDVVARARRLLRERRIGHTGTLDPFATGVLVLLVGRATRLAQFLAGAEKEYEALVRFGYATETGDLTGVPLGTEDKNEDESMAACPAWSAAEIEAALQALRGRIEQVPPMYSAKKVQGRKLYEMARRGEEIERKPVAVVISEFEAVPQEGALLKRNADGTCDLAARVVCSAGTYVRVLAESLGARLGVGAHLAALRRTRAGAWTIADAASLDELAELAEAGAATKILRSPDAALSHLPFAHLTADEARRARHGAAVRVAAAPEWMDGSLVRMRDEEGNLIAVGIYTAADRQLRTRVLLVGAEK